jgi:hypothetical protein
MEGPQNLGLHVAHPLDELVAQLVHLQAELAAELEHLPAELVHLAA